MQRFKSHGQAQRFLSCHGVINNLFRFGRHLIQAKHYPEFRDRAFSEWVRQLCPKFRLRGIWWSLLASVR